MEAGELQWFTTANNTGSSAGTITSVHNNAASPSANGIIILSPIPAGTTNASRMGFKCSLKSLEVRGFTQTTVVNSPPVTMNIGRIIFYTVRNNQFDAVGAGAAASDPATFIQDWAVGYAGVINNFHPEMVPSQVRILFDKTISLFNAPGGTTGAVIPWHFKCNLEKHFRGQPTTYASSLGTASASAANHVFACFIQGESVGTPTNGQLQSTWGYSLMYTP